MQEVIQNDVITLTVQFYDRDPSAGGVPTDPDNYLNSWDIQNDLQSRVSDIALFYNSVWPPNTTYYWSIVDSGVDFSVNVYLDAGRTTLLASTGALAYGVYVWQAVAEIGGSGYAGNISITFPGIGVGFETFEIVSIGATGPTYEIRDEGNSTVVTTTIFPTRLGVGSYQTTYHVPATAIPGENWRLSATGVIAGIIGFVDVYFRVVDATDVEDEAAKLITLSELKVALELTDVNTVRDEALEDLILVASKICEDTCGQEFHLESRQILFDGNGLRKWFLEGSGAVGPIYDVALLEYRYEIGTFTTLDAQYYTFSDMFLEIISDYYCFECGTKNWRMTYTSGYEKAPPQIRRAVKELCRHWYFGRNRAGIRSETIGIGIKVDYADVATDLPESVKQMFAQFRRLF